jgi:hypothetical protein
MGWRFGPLALPWPDGSTAVDPYWDAFINRPARDPRNSVPEIIRGAPDGAVNPAKEDIHTPEVTASHIKDLARYLGADLVGIVRLNGPDAAEGSDYPFAVVCAVRAEHDPREAPGIGGQVPVENGLFTTFVLGAYIRELGFRAVAAADPHAERLAAAAGLGRLDAAGRLVTPRFGARVHVADVIRTDLPLAADG